MAITIKYFGAIAEAAGTEEETVKIQTFGRDLESLKTHCLNKHGSINDYSFKLAVNQSIVENTPLNDGDVVAFLPPFAGG